MSRVWVWGLGLECLCVFGIHAQDHLTSEFLEDVDPLSGCPVLRNLLCSKQSR